MKCRKIQLLLLPVLFVCTACPYKSTVPIGMPEEKVDKHLLGKWQKDDDSENYYIVEKLDKYQYQITENAYNPKEDVFETSYYQGHITVINKQPFLSIINQKIENDGEENLYYLYKIEMTGDSAFILYPLSNYIREEFEKSNDLRIFIGEHMHLSFFYGDEETYTKLGMP